MRHKYLLLLLSLAVVLGACKKNDPDPPLEGRWNPESATVYYYDGTGTLTRQADSPNIVLTYAVITQDSLIYRLVGNDLRMASSGPITRQGNSFSFSSFTSYNVLIQELTDHKLVLHFKFSRPLPGAPYTEHQETYSR